MTRYLPHFALSLFASLAFVGEVWAQTPDPAAAKEHFKHHNYRDAIPEFKKLIKAEPKNADYHHKLGYCYIHTQIDKTLAIAPLEKAIKLQRVDAEAFYDLGKAYTYDYQFDKAIEAFNKYKALVTGKAEKIKKADLAIASCEEAKKLMERPVDVSFTNMGSQINSVDPDYYPYTSKDGQVLVFTSRRKANKGGGREVDGYYSSDVWLVMSDETGYSTAKNAGSVNTSYDEQTVGITDDGSTVFVYIDHIDEYGDIYTSKRNGTKFGRRAKMSERVNTKAFETSASMSADGKTLFFASDRSGGYGGLDLWMSRMLPNGEWAEPQNLGPEINTAYDEGFPSLSYDNKTLYFTSEGHPGMGGFDIFKSIWNSDKNTFTAPQNLGYPINTPEDNRTISFTEDGKHAFVSALRKGGFGDYDIYKLTYNSVDVNPAIFKLTLNTGDSINPIAKEGVVYMYNMDGDEVGVYAPNPNSGNIIIALMPGAYSMEIEVDGFAMVTEDFFIADFHLRSGEIKKEIQLERE